MGWSRVKRFYHPVCKLSNSILWALQQAAVKRTIACDLESNDNRYIYVRTNSILDRFVLYSENMYVCECVRYFCSKFAENDVYYIYIFYSILFISFHRRLKKKMTMCRIKTPIDCQWCVWYVFRHSLFETLFSFRFVSSVLTVNADIQQLMMKNRRNWSFFCYWKDHRSDHTHICKRIYI